VDTLAPEERSQRMRLIRGFDTNPERAVRSIIHKMGYRFRKHCALLPGKPDVVFPRRKKVIFVHGCFWHRHGCSMSRLPKSRLDFWRHKFEVNCARDLRNTQSLMNAGWKVLIIWECEIKDESSVKNFLRKFLNEEH
jgi:DNA mismatch endonuclease (patch repair protein)